MPDRIPVNGIKTGLFYFLHPTHGFSDISAEHGRWPQKKGPSGLKYVLKPKYQTKPGLPTPPTNVPKNVVQRVHIPIDCYTVV